MCVLSVEKDGKRHAVGRALFPLEGELGQAGRVLWRDLDPEEVTQVNTNTSTHIHKEVINMLRMVLPSNLCQCSELGDVQISLSYSSSLQRLSLVVLGARGLQLLTDAGLKNSINKIKAFTCSVHHSTRLRSRRCVCPGELADTHSDGEDEA